MTTILLFGATLGSGLFLALWLFLPQGSSAGSDLARIDAERRRAVQTSSLVADRRHESENLRLRKLGAPIVRELGTRGVGLHRLRADLGLIGRSLELHAARTVIMAVGGMLFLTVMSLVARTLFGSGVELFSILAAPVGLLLGLLLPTADLRKQAAVRRRDFRHVVSSFLDLVAMNLAGGRGVPEALTAASAVSNGWAMIRLRDALENARLQGVTPWAALGQLGDELDIDELRDLAATLTLVADDGAKVRDSLSARAASMRTRELAELESRAQANSQSMLVAQLLLCLGFLIFLMYPAIATVLSQ